VSTQQPLDVSALFKPFQCGALALKNRIVMAPMTRCFCPGGVPGADVAAYYERRAAANVGLIITEGTWVPHASASNDDAAPRFHGEDALAGWKRVVDRVHTVGGTIMPQLWHVGLVSKPAIENLYETGVDPHARALSPSGILLPGQQLARPASERQIAELIDAYAQAARSAADLGFDGLELHGAHGYLIDQFLWDQTNVRDDAWGGDPARRGRFAVEIVKACRARTRPDFPIVFRFSQWKQQDYTARPWKRPQDLAAFLEPLADAGVDIFHASQRRFWEAEFEGSGLNLAGWAQRLTGRPAIAVGSVGLDSEMLQTFFSDQPAMPGSLDRLVAMMERGEFDLVAVGRALLGDPDWVEKVRRGEWSSLRAVNKADLAVLS
jgi:2,4-dienoyl-CoA reductase-like NADH-dependent reductase (Old Yellow Enzyme family)